MKICVLICLSVILCSAEAESNILPLPAGIESKNLITIKAGNRTKEQNRINQKRCEDMGGYDVSDKQDMVVSKNTKDPIACHITDIKKAQQYDKTHNSFTDESVH